MLRTPERSRQKLIVSQLDNLCKTLHTNYWVNFGGCCYVAYCIAKGLRKLKIPYSLIITRRSDEPAFGEYEECLRRREHLYTYSHYAIEVPDIGMINVKDFHLERDILTISNIIPTDIYYIYSTGEWNDSYNTDNNKNIRKSINQCIAKIVEEMSQHIPTSMVK